MTKSIVEFVDLQPTDFPAAHHLPLADLLQRLAVEEHHGLSQEEAEKRIARFEPNALPMPATRATWLKFIDQFKSLLIVVLMVVASLAALVGNLKDAAVILAVVLLNAALGFYQEYRAERSLAALRDMLPVRARVRRDGATSEVDAKLLAPGDIVLLEAGDRVPADGRLIQVASVAVDESFSPEGPSRFKRKLARRTARRSARRAPQHDLHEYAGHPRTRRNRRNPNLCGHRRRANFEGARGRLRQPQPASGTA